MVREAVGIGTWDKQDEDHARRCADRDASLPDDAPRSLGAMYMPDDIMKSTGRRETLKDTL